MEKQKTSSKKLKINPNKQVSIKNDVFTKVFKVYASRGGWKIFRMALYTILPVFFALLLILSTSLWGLLGPILFITFGSLTLTSIFCYAAITRDLKESNIITKHIISRAKKIFIELVPILFFLLFGIILFSINMFLVTFLFSLNSISAINDILFTIDWLTLYLGAFLTILMALGVSRFIAVHFESKASFIIARVVLLVFVGFFSGASLFGTNTLMDITFFKVLSYFNPFTYPFTILNISVSKAVPINDAFFNSQLLGQGIVTGTNFWNFGDPLAVISADANDKVFIQTVFYHASDKYLALTFALILPLSFLYFSSNYLRPFKHLYHLNFIKEESFSEDVPMGKQVVKKIKIPLKKEEK